MEALTGNCNAALRRRAGCNLCAHNPTPKTELDEDWQYADVPRTIRVDSLYPFG